MVSGTRNVDKHGHKIKHWAKRIATTFGQDFESKHIPLEVDLEEVAQHELEELACYFEPKLHGPTKDAKADPHDLAALALGELLYCSRSRNECGECSSAAKAVAKWRLKVIRSRNSSPVNEGDKPDKCAFLVGSSPSKTGKDLEESDLASTMAPSCSSSPRMLEVSPSRTVAWSMTITPETPEEPQTQAEELDRRLRSDEACPLLAMKLDAKKALERLHRPVLQEELDAAQVPKPIDIPHIFQRVDSRERLKDPTCNEGIPCLWFAAPSAATESHYDYFARRFPHSHTEPRVVRRRKIESQRHMYSGSMSARDSPFSTPLSSRPSTSGQGVRSRSAKSSAPPLHDVRVQGDSRRTRGDEMWAQVQSARGKRPHRCWTVDSELGSVERTLTASPGHMAKRDPLAVIAFSKENKLPSVKPPRTPQRFQQARAGRYFERNSPSRVK